MRLEALERGRRRAKEEAELERLTEVEANRLTEEGKRQRQKETERARRVAARIAKIERPPVDLSPAFAGLPTEADWDPANARRLAANVRMNEITNQVSAQIRKALPEIAAAVSANQNGDSSG